MYCDRGVWCPYWFVFESVAWCQRLFQRCWVLAFFHMVCVLAARRSAAVGGVCVMRVGCRFVVCLLVQHHGIQLAAFRILVCMHNNMEVEPVAFYFPLPLDCHRRYVLVPVQQCGSH